MKFIMISGYVGLNPNSPPPWLEKVIDNHKKVSQIACIEYKFETESSPCLPKSSPDLFHMGSASKPYYLLKYLNLGYDYVFWIDPDAFITKADAYPLGFESEHKSNLSERPSVVFTGDKYSIYNGGHILVRNTPQAHSIISEWIRVLEYNIPRQLAPKISPYCQLTKDNNNLRGDQTAFNIALTTNIKQADDLMLGLCRSHRYAPRLKVAEKFRPPLRQSDCHYILTNIIRHEWQKHIQVIPQDQLNSYPVTCDPKAKYSLCTSHIHYAGASKYFLHEGILLHELTQSSVRWRLIYAVSQVLVKTVRLDPLLIYPYLHKTIKRARQLCSL